MSLPWATVPLQRFVARHLAERSEELTALWLGRLLERQSEGPLRIFPGDTLRNHIPSVIAKLASTIEQQLPPGDVDLLREEVEALAGLRRRQGNGLDELLIEFDSLRDILLEAVAEAAADYGGELPSSEAVRIAVRLEKALLGISRYTADFFGRARDVESLERQQLPARFGRSVTHELRNRLDAALMTLKVLERKAGPQLGGDARSLLRDLEELLRGTGGVVEGVLAVTNAGANPAGARARKLPLSEVVGEVVTQIEELARARSVALGVAGPLPHFYVDASRVQLALVNLLSNAIKYCDPAKGSCWVRISGEGSAQGLWRVDVTDNGVGIPAEDQERIFLERVRAHDDAAVSGDGIGLTLAREAIEQLGGRIWVESTPGQGSTFSFTLDEPGHSLVRPG